MSTETCVGAISDRLLAEMMTPEMKIELRRKSHDEFFNGITGRWFTIVRIAMDYFALVNEMQKLGDYIADKNNDPLEIAKKNDLTVEYASVAHAKLRRLKWLLGFTSNIDLAKKLNNIIRRGERCGWRVVPDDWIALPDFGTHKHIDEVIRLSAQRNSQIAALNQPQPKPQESNPSKEDKEQENENN